MSEFLDQPPVRPSVLGRMADRVFYAILIALCTIALLVMVSLVYDSFFNVPAIRYLSTSDPLIQPVCPGDILEIRNYVEVKTPTIASVFVSVLEKGTNDNLPGTSYIYPPLLHPYSKDFEQIINWEVPKSLEPGEYDRVMAIRGHSSTQKPIFVFYAFIIDTKENCTRRNLQ